MMDAEAPYGRHFSEQPRRIRPFRRRVEASVGPELRGFRSTPAISATTQSGQSIVIRVSIALILPGVSFEDESDVDEESEKWRPHFGHSYLATPSCLWPSAIRGTLHPEHLGSLLFLFERRVFSNLGLSPSLLSDSAESRESAAAISSSDMDETAALSNIKSPFRQLGGVSGEGLSIICWCI